MSSEIATYRCSNLYPSTYSGTLPDNEETEFVSRDAKRSDCLTLFPIAAPAAEVIVLRQILLYTS
jgi:hypothetical protein